MRLSAELPTAHLHGFDISDALYPERLPARVQLHITDVKQPCPPEFAGKFDLVHIRTLTPSMMADEWAPALQHVLALLKPGGALQWEEPNWTTVELVRGRDASSTAGARAMTELFKEVLSEKTAAGWNTLPALFAEAGVERVEKDIVSSDRLPETRWALSVNTMVAMCLFADIMAKRGATERAARLEQFGNQGFLDIDSGSYVRWDMHITSGFKSRKAG